MKMQKHTVAVITMLIGAIVAGFFGPWWSPAIIIVSVTASLNLSAKSGILFGSLTLGAVFLFMALYQYSLDEANIISRTGFLLNGLSPITMLFITTLIGLVTGLLAGWLGSSLGDLFVKKPIQ
jgi:hypothetical protein